MAAPDYPAVCESCSRPICGGDYITCFEGQWLHSGCALNEAVRANQARANKPRPSQKGPAATEEAQS